MHNPESVLENETHNVRWDFKIQTYHLISTRQRNSQQKIERASRIVDFAVQADNRVKVKRREKRDKHQDLTREQKKLHGTWKWR